MSRCRFPAKGRSRQRFRRRRRTCQARLARRRRSADYICFNDDVRRSADQHQVLDVVAADENEAPARVDARVVDDGESRRVERTHLLRLKLSTRHHVANRGRVPLPAARRTDPARVQGLGDLSQ